MNHPVLFPVFASCGLSYTSDCCQSAVRRMECYQRFPPSAALRCAFLLAGLVFAGAGQGDALESSAMPGTPEYMRPVGRFENLPAENSSVLQCYIFPTRAGVIYQVESSHDMAHWTTEGDEIHALGHEQVLTMREFTPPPPGSPPPGPLAPPPIRTSLRLARPADASACTVVSWASLDDKRAVVKVLSQPLENCWQRMPFYWRRYGNHDFSLVTNLSTLPLPSEDPVLGPKDAAMFAQLESSFQDMTQEVIDSIARARNAPPPAPVDPMSRKFFRVRCDWSVDTDADGTPDWMEFEMAGWSAEGPTPPLRADAFVADTNGDGIPDGQQLDYDKDGIPDSQDAGPQDASMAFQITPPPRYALFPITNAQPSEDIPDPLQINDQGTVLYANGIWKAGTWQALADNGPGLDSAQARALNDHDVILGVAKDSNDQGWTCFWPDPAAAPLLVATGEGIRAGMADLSAAGNGYDLTNNLLSPGTVLSNDGSFFMTANVLDGEGPQWKYLRHSKWRLPTYQNSSTTETASADRGLRYESAPDLFWGSAENNSEIPGLVYAPDLLPGLPFSPMNVVRLPGARILAMPSGGGSDLARVYHNGAWSEKTAFTHAIDCNAFGTAIGSNHGSLSAPILINGKWIDIVRHSPHEKAVLSVPSPWFWGTTRLLDTSPSGWILAKNDSGLHDYAALLPIRVEGRYQKSDGSIITTAVGVDDFSITSDTPGDAVQDRIWIMAPQGGSSKTANFKAPLNGNTPVSLFAANILFGGQEKATLSAPVVPVSLSASDAVASGDERLASMILGTGGGEVLSESKPLGLKIMKQRTVNVTVYKVTKIHGTNAMEPVDQLMMPTEREISDHLNDLFKPQINTAFHVNVVEAPLEVRWDANNNSHFDIDIFGTEGGGEERAILDAVPSNAHPYDIRVFVVANVGPLGEGIDAYGLTNIATGTCWVHGSRFGRNKTKAFMLDSMAHEIGHVMVGEGHPDGRTILGPAPLPGTDHTRRLMCSGIRSNSSSRLLVKGEWDAAERWLHKKIDTLNAQ